MAKSQFKAGGPTRGRKRIRKIGMGSGAWVAKVHDQRKGVSATATEEAPKKAAKG